MSQVSLSLVFSDAIVAYRAAYAELRADPSVACFYVDAVDGGFSVTREFSADRSIVCISRKGMVTLTPQAVFVRTV